MQGIERKKEKDIDDVFRDGKLRSLSFVFLKKCDVELTNDIKVFEPFQNSTDNWRDHPLWRMHQRHILSGGVSFAGAVSGTMA